MINKPGETSVKLVPLREKHLAAVWEWVNDPALAPMIGTVFPVSRHEHAAWFRSLKKDPRRRFFAIMADGRHVGNTGVKMLYPEDGRAELFLFIGDAGDRRRGIGAVATRRLTELCFREFQIHKVYVTIFAYNKAALACYGSAGFAREAVWREHLYRNGRYHDVIVLSRINNGLL